MKYIIELPDEFAEATKEYWDKTVGMQLEPYIESDRECIENEVWSFVNFLENKLKVVDYESIFNTDCPYDKYTYQEAQSMFETWVKQRDEIHVGDEVANLTDYKGVVVKIYDDKTVNVMWDNGNVGNYKTNIFHKTGRHFNEVEKLLEKMEEN